MISTFDDNQPAWQQPRAVYISNSAAASVRWVMCHVETSLKFGILMAGLRAACVHGVVNNAGMIGLLV